MSEKTEWMKLQGEMPDGGPVYTETDIHQFIAEPWNGISSLAFLIPAIYWFWICRKNSRENILLITCCLLLTIGGLGSTFFHAFRKSPFLLWMDIFPIIMLTMIISVFFWLKILKKWWWIFPIILPAVFFRYWIKDKFTAHEAINIGYFISGTLIFFPILLLLIKTNFKNWISILFAFLLLALALFFRKIDSNTPPLMSIGTHWLWHLFCAGGAYFLGNFIYKIENTHSKIKG